MEEWMKWNSAMKEATPAGWPKEMNERTNEMEMSLWMVSFIWCLMGWLDWLAPLSLGGLWAGWPAKGSAKERERSKQPIHEFNQTNQFIMNAVKASNLLFSFHQFKQINQLFGWVWLIDEEKEEVDWTSDAPSSPAARQALQFRNSSNSFHKRNGWIADCWIAVFGGASAVRSSSIN